MKRRTFFTIFLFAFTFAVFSQEEEVSIRDLQVNPQAGRAVKRLKTKQVSAPDSLPFFEDFSLFQSQVPNPSKWQDDQVFINANFPYLPPSIGVATFDAFDANGYLYPQASSYAFSADTLTSQPLRLDSIFRPEPAALPIVGDTLFLSFYFQPGGGFGSVSNPSRRGRSPGKNDLLILEFLKNDTIWEEVWRTNGGSLEAFCPLCAKEDTTDIVKPFFSQVQIPIAEPEFLSPNFQFRFRNLTSLDPEWQTRGGQWHVDYIRIDFKGNILASNDIAFVEQNPRVLKEFQAMPVKQFRDSLDLLNEISVRFKNLDTIPQNTRYSFQISGSSYLWEAVETNTDIYPFDKYGFNYNTDIYEGQRNFRLPKLSSSDTFRFRHVLKSQGFRDVCADNDTMVQTVCFGNFFAYDDGSAEAGFGLNSANSRFAYQFPLYVRDTLCAVQIFFNHTLSDMRQAYLKLMVWSAGPDSLPDRLLYEGSDFLPQYNERIGFQTVPLDDLLELSEGLFFIGFQQKTEIYLNLGFDQNNFAANRMFYHNTSNEGWLPVYYHGSVMMRPIFGSTAMSGTIEKRGSEEPVVLVYPNPGGETVFVETIDNPVKAYEIYDLTGKRVGFGSASGTRISLQLPQNPGMYFLMLQTAKGVITKKVVRR